MEITTLCFYEVMCQCKSDAWETQKASCTFAEKSRNRKGCMYHGAEDSLCDNIQAQKIAYVDYKNKS